MRLIYSSAFKNTQVYFLTWRASEDFHRFWAVSPEGRYGRFCYFTDQLKSKDHLTHKMWFKQHIAWHEQQTVKWSEVSEVRRVHDSIF